MSTMDLNGTTTATTTTTTSISLFETSPGVWNDISSALASGCIPSVLKRFDCLLKATQANTFVYNRDRLLYSIHTPFGMDEFIESFLPTLHECVLSNQDKTKLRLVVQSLLPPKEEKATHPPLCINGRLGMQPYTNPPFNEKEAAVKARYMALLVDLESPYAIEQVEDELELLATFVRVRSFTDAVDARELSSARHAPVTRRTGECVHYTCKCDRQHNGFVVVSGCVKCCARMPKNVSRCKCQQHFKVWKGYEEADLVCNHPGQFDATKFAMMFFNTHICSLCSEQTDGHCEHRVLAVDADQLYDSGVADATDSAYVDERISDLECEEAIFHRELRRAHSRRVSREQQGPRKRARAHNSL